MIPQQDTSAPGDSVGYEDIEEITGEAHYQRIDQPNDILLLDVRNESEFESWRIDSRYTPETMHIPYTIFAEDGPLRSIICHSVSAAYRQPAAVC